jgi:hypothetical protein
MLILQTVCIVGSVVFFYLHQPLQAALLALTGPATWLGIILFSCVEEEVGYWRQRRQRQADQLMEPDLIKALRRGEAQAFDETLSLLQENKLLQIRVKALESCVAALAREPARRKPVPAPTPQAMPMPELPDLGGDRHDAWL